MSFSPLMIDPITGRQAGAKGGVRGRVGASPDLNDFLQQHYQQQQDYTSLFYYYNISAPNALESEKTVSEKKTPQNFCNIFCLFFCFVLFFVLLFVLNPCLKISCCNSIKLWKFWILEIYRISEFLILENYGINYNSKKGRYNPVVVGSVVVGNH